MPARYFHRIGWAVLMAAAGVMLFALSLHVNAVKSEVRRAEMKIASLRQEKLYLETEFETRANQQQLESWNDVEFGYVAPGPGQYFEGARQLAVLGKPAGPDAPEPIRYATVPKAPLPALPALLSPLTGGTPAKPEPRASTAPVNHDKAVASLGQRLVRVDGLSLPARAGGAQVKGDSGQ